MKFIRCENCRLLFGIVDKDGNLNIKHRELYRTIKGGVVYGPCRRCGQTIWWPGDNQSAR